MLTVMNAIIGSRQQLLNNSLVRQKSPNDLCTLYSLFPGVAKNRFDGSRTPQEEELKYNDLSSTQEACLRNSFLKKYPGFTGTDPKGVAKAKFLFYEHKCSEANDLFRQLRQGKPMPWLNDVLFVAQRKIASVLGKFDLQELLMLSRWGPGSTSSCKDPDVSASAKFSSRPDVTRQSLSLVRLCMPLLPSWSALLADQDYGCMVNPIYPIIEGNKVTFVPKTAETDRTIAIEPHINVYFQIGLGRMIRRRMKQRAHVDLDDQTLNQRLARLGSIDDSLSTIDLEGASDTICKELVRELLPETWFQWLDSFRSHTGTLDGDLIRYEKFSSMGNGATFDLESLIFWALSSAVVELEGYNPFWVNVFGDDIVVPSGCFDKVTEALTLCGFIPNLRKSFHLGPFRESCGHDYYKGVNIRPVYLKKVPSSSMDWILIANQIRVLAHRWAQYKGCDTRLYPAYLFALSRIDECHRHLKVPYAMQNVIGANENVGILSNFDEATPYLVKDKENRGFEGFFTRSLQGRSRVLKRTDRALLTSSIFSPGSTSNRIPIRKSVVYREKTLFIPGEWYNLGPWANFREKESPMRLRS